MNVPRKRIYWLKLLYTFNVNKLITENYEMYIVEYEQIVRKIIARLYSRNS